MELWECLDQTPPEDLRRMAAALGVKDAESDSPGPAIAAFLKEPDSLRRVLDGLSEEERSALKVVYFGGGDRGITVELCQQIVGLLLGRRRRSSALALEGLTSRGLVFVRPLNYRQVFFIPTDLVPVIRETLTREVLERLQHLEAPVQPLPRERWLLEDLHRFLAYVQAGGIALTQQGQIFKRDLRALIDLLAPGSAPAEPAPGRYPEPLGLLVGYTMDRRLVTRTEGRLVASPDLERWVDGPDGEKALDLFRYWQDRYYYQDLQSFLRFAGSVEGRWLSVERLVGELEPLINPSQRGSFLVRLRHHLSTFLGPLGLFDLAQCPRREGAEPDLLCRLTGAGAAILAGKAPAEAAPESGSHLLLQSTFEAIVRRPAPGRLLWHLELMADLALRTDRTLTYRISRSSFYRALKSGLEGGELIDFLERSSARGVPQNVAFDLRAWAGAYGQVWLQEVMLLRCADPILAEQIKASRRTEAFILGQLTPTDLIVRPDLWQELLEALEADGLMPRPAIDRPGRPG